MTTLKVTVVILLTCLYKDLLDDSVARVVIIWHGDGHVDGPRSGGGGHNLQLQVCVAVLQKHDHKARAKSILGAAHCVT